MTARQLNMAKICAIRRKTASTAKRNKQREEKKAAKREENEKQKLKQRKKRKKAADDAKNADNTGEVGVTVPLPFLFALSLPLPGGFVLFVMYINHFCVCVLLCIDSFYNATGQQPELGWFFKAPGISAAIAKRSGAISGAANCPCLHSDGRVDNKYCMKSGLFRCKLKIGQWVVFLKSTQKDLGGDAFAVSTTL